MPLDNNKRLLYTIVMTVRQMRIVHSEEKFQAMRELWIKSTLANDEASTDEELTTHLITEGLLTLDEANQWIEKRGEYLRQGITGSDIARLKTIR